MWKLILAIPDMIRFFFMIKGMVEKYNQDLQDKRKQEAIENVNDAKTEEEQNEAWDDYFKRGP